MSYNVNLNNNIKHNTIKRSKTVCGIRQKKQIGHLQSLSVGLSKSYGKIIKPTWSEKYNKLSKNNDLVLDELLEQNIH